MSINTTHSSQTPQALPCPCQCTCSWPLLAQSTAHDPDLALAADSDRGRGRDPSLRMRNLQLLIAASDNPLEAKPDPLLFSRPQDADINSSDCGPATLDLTCPPGLCFDQEIVIMSNARWIELYKGTSSQLFEYATSCAGEQVDGDIHVAFVPTDGATHVRLKLVSLPKHQPDVLKLQLLQVSTKPAPSALSPAITPLPMGDLPPNLSVLAGLMSLLPTSSQPHDLSSLSRDTTATSMLAAAAATLNRPSIELTSATAGSGGTSKPQAEANHWDRLFDRLDAFEARVVDSFEQINERFDTLEARIAALEVHVGHHFDPTSPHLPPA